MSLEHVANALCLEYTNTINNRNDPRVDWLASEESVRAWARSLDLELTGPVPVEHARALREAVYSVFLAIARAQPAPAEDVATIDSASKGDSGATLSWDGDSYRRGFPVRLSFDQLEVRVAESAVDLLLSQSLHRVRECPRCGWLFLDVSKNGTRRWCSMAMCGGRVKARRHYERITGPGDYPGFNLQLDEGGKIAGTVENTNGTPIPANIEATSDVYGTIPQRR